MVSPVAASALRGEEFVAVNLAAFGRILRPGHVVGFNLGGYAFAHVVMAASYTAADVATLQVSPPLRRDVTTSDRLQFRPSLTATCSNAREAAGTFSRGRHMTLSEISWVETLV